MVNGSEITLREALNGLVETGSLIDEGRPVVAVTEDSRQVGPGSVFVAIKGMTADGHDYVNAAVDAGAEAVVVSREIDAKGRVPVVRVADTRAALGLISANVNGKPADHMTLVGVTGTNGKTTVCYLLEAILKSAGKIPGVIGTVNYRYRSKTFTAPYTTPTPPVLHATLREMKEANCTHVLMEVSSHALEMQRVHGLCFAAAGFTNLTQDHLDIHGGMEQYLQAKQKLFKDHLDGRGVAVAWGDDPNAQRMLAPFSGQKIFCSAVDRSADVHLLESSMDLCGVRAVIGTEQGEIDIRSSMVGSTNLANIILAAGMALALEVSIRDIKKGIESVGCVPGRLERVLPGGFFEKDVSAPHVLVDYAHTPDAISKVVSTLKSICKGRLFIVFGCGGDRDKTKRPLMGRAAGNADIAVVTSDNPRTENPEAIIESALVGVFEAGLDELKGEELKKAQRGCVVIPDRRAAIRRAVLSAGENDVVLIAGKGHEDYQILGTKRVHFDDREEAAHALKIRGQKSSGGEK